jgi:deoxyribonuclease-4
VRLGAHLTIRQGLPEAAALAHAIGANTFAYFTRNPRGGRARAVTPQEVAHWEKRRRELDIFPIVGHMPYVVNMASRDEGLRRFAGEVIREDMARSATFGGELLVCHPGSHQGDGVETGIRRIVAVLSEALPGGGPVTFCLEAMAGSGSEVGARFSELAAVLDGLGWPEEVGVCLDTCHLFAAGYGLAGAELAALKEEIEATVGLERVRVIHLNDSLGEQGSRKDRHAKLGEGRIGRATLTAFLSDPDFRRLPVIVETPVAAYEEYGEEIAKVRSWMRAAEERGPAEGVDDG